MNIISFNGCSTTPLGSYLKALGIMRILSEQADESMLGWWEEGVFIASTQLSKEEVIGFFLNEYSPTPIISPWNSDSGFLKNKGAAYEAVSNIERLLDKRLASYHSSISITRQVISKIGITSENLSEKKDELLLELRNSLPDSSIVWLDSAYTVNPDPGGKVKAIYPHMLGTGGNDGRLDFAVNFMQNVYEIFKDHMAEVKLTAALYANEEKPAGKKSAVGFFDPGGIGGPNATAGFEGDSLVNPWDFILMLEGVVLFAGSPARRLSADRTKGSASFPFSVAASSAGYTSASSFEQQGSKRASRGETWIPIWERPTTLDELIQVFSEGRANLGRKRANSGLDFARAIASLGVDRGIKGFYRYSFLRRSGKNYIAVPLVFHQTHNKSVQGIDLLREIDPWLDAVRGFVGKNTPASKALALRGLEESIYEFSIRGDRFSLQRVLEGIGHMEEEISILHEREGKDERKKPHPLSGLSFRWVKACDDGSPEFALAAGLASLRGSSSVASIRHYLEPVELVNGRLVWRAEQGAQVKGAGSISKMLASMLEKICLDYKKSGETREDWFSARTVSMKDIDSFLRDEIDESRLVRLLKGLILVKWPGEPSGKKEEGLVVALNRDYILLKALFLTGRVEVGEVELGFSPELRILNLLRAGNVEIACREAGRRLRAKMLVPAGDFGLSGIDGRRLAASLIFPVDVSRFSREYLPLVLKKKDIS